MGQKTLRRKNDLIMKKGVMHCRSLLQDEGVTTIEAPELEPYDFSADIQTRQNINLILRFKLSHMRFRSSYVFRKGNGKRYEPGDFHISACDFSTRTGIFAAGIPDRARYKTHLFEDEKFASVMYNAVQTYLNSLTKQLGGNKELKYVRQ